MLRNVPRLPAVMLAAALSGLLLMLGGTATAATARSHSAAPADARPSSDRGATVTKATLHKVDAGARSQHDQNGLGPDLAALPVTGTDGGRVVGAARASAAREALHGRAASPTHSRAPPR
ncbi:hypothetical protein [Mumia sp. DW29H23]|uniref:hypothetical protein n=1 Tax=Mumia sp. DW29H23 TaxID=3421241 RepID=UPI003D682ECC